MFYGMSTLVGYLMPNPVYIGVVAIEKGAFGTSSTTVTNLFIYDF